MMMHHDFSREELLATIREAEDLARRIDTMHEGHEQMRLIYRWATTADQVARLLVQAEEFLSQEELLALRRYVNQNDSARWSTYRRNIRWMNKPSNER